MNCVHEWKLKRVIERKEENELVFRCKKCTLISYRIEPVRNDEPEDWLCSKCERSPEMCECLFICSQCNLEKCECQLPF